MIFHLTSVRVQNICLCGDTIAYKFIQTCWAQTSNNFTITHAYPAIEIRWIAH